MKDEVRSAVNFLKEHLETTTSLSPKHIDLFRDNLEYLMIERFQNHWHPEKPLKGNAFRCLNVDSTAIDPLLVKASTASGISPLTFQQMFPDGLALWIDPMDVCCRIGKRPVIRTIYGNGWVNNSKGRDQLNHINLKSSPYQCSFEKRPRNPYNYRRDFIPNYQGWNNNQFNYLTAQVY